MKWTRWIAFGTALIGTSPAIGFQVRNINLLTNDIAWDRANNRFLAAIPSTGGANANRIAHVNTVTGSVVRSVAAGSDPTRLTLSTSGRFIHFGSTSSPAYRTMDLTTFTVGAPRTLPQANGEMAAVPGSDTRVAIAVSPNLLGIYDNGVLEQPFYNPEPGEPRAPLIGFGSSPNRLYGFSNLSSDGPMSRFTLGERGLALSSFTQYVGPDNNPHFVVSGTSAYFTRGRRVDLETAQVLGTYGATGLVWANETLNRTAYLTPLNLTQHRLTFFELDTYVPIGQTVISGVRGNPFRLIQTGASEIAFRTDQGQVFFVRTNLVPEPGTLFALGLGAATLAWRRRKRARARGVED